MINSLHSSKNATHHSSATSLVTEAYIVKPKSKKLRRKYLLSFLVENKWRKILERMEKERDISRERCKREIKQDEVERTIRRGVKRHVRVGVRVYYRMQL